MDSVNVIKGVLYNIGTQATNYSATSGATAVANLKSIDDFPTVAKKLRDVTLNADTVESFKPGRRAAVSDLSVTVFLVTAGYTFAGNATAGYRLDMPVDSTSTTATTYLQMWFPAATLHTEKVNPGGEDQEASVVLSIRPGGVPLFATATY
jgi:hypothetical protein